MNYMKLDVLVKGLLVSWLICIYTLHPFPWRDASYFDENSEVMREIILRDAERQGKKLSTSEIGELLQAQIAIEKSHVWRNWGLHVVAVILGIVSCVLFLIRRDARWSLWCIVATSVGFLSLWIFPHLSGRGSPVESYVTVASGVIAGGSAALLLGFIIFNVIFPIVHMAAVVVLTKRAALTGKTTG